MLKEICVNLSELLLSFSDAIDFINPQVASHQLRTAFVAWRIGRAAKLSSERVEKIFMAALLHDIGALTTEEKVRLYSFEEQDVHIHCLYGELLFNLTPILRPAAKIVRFHHKSWSDWKAPIDSPDVFESQILLLSDLVERLVRRDILYPASG